MNTAIKILEEIGQNTSIKQHESLVEMLKSLDISEGGLDYIKKNDKEFVCMLVPADDSDSDDEKEKEGDSESE